MVETLRTYFATHEAGVDVAYLFGSMARGTARSDSDVDVAVLPRERIGGTVRRAAARSAAVLRAVSPTGVVTDPDLIAKKLAFVETCVHELQTLARPDLVASDIRERRFVEHTLQIAIQAALDTASHIVSDDRLGEPRSNRELFDLLVSAGWPDSALGARLRRMVGFRNILVHGYTAVDAAVVRDVLAHNLVDLLAFAAAIRRRSGP